MKKVLITGASRGIGRATALLFAQNGYFVYANYKNSDSDALTLKEEIEKSGGKCELIKADICNFNLPLNIDVLVNNAGISQTKLFCDTTTGDINDIVNTNLLGTINVTKNILPYMIQNKSGSIINISSIWGVTGGSTEVLYSTTKAAIIGFTKSLAKELGPSGITVNAVAPGLIDTDMNSDLSDDDKESFTNELPINKIGSPYDVAKAILFLAESSYITGQVLNVDGGYII